ARLEPGDARLSERNLAIAAIVQEVADELGARPVQVSLAWLRAQPGVVIPIVGARTAGQLEESLGCLGFELPEEAIRRLDEASRVPLGFPHDMLGALLGPQIAAGGMPDDHRGALPANIR